MPNTREIKRRISSVQSTRQITRTMEMVATAKVKHATDRIAAAAPYSDAMARTLANVSEHSEGSDNPYLVEHGSYKRAIAIVVVSDRGLAGGFNSNIFRAVGHYFADNAKKDIETEVIACGKKAIAYYAYRRIEPLMDFTDLSADPTIEEAREISLYVRDAYVNEQVDEVKIFYNHARNAADQDVRDERILPITTADLGDVRAEEGDAITNTSQDFEPDADAVLDSLLPAYVETMIYHALIDSAAAEQGARRKAMKSATDNADEMIETLNRQYNRVRQGAITTEITEIVGGAAALED